MFISAILLFSVDSRAFDASLKWQFEELQFLAVKLWLHSSPAEIPASV